MTLASNPKLKKFLKDAEAYCRTQGWQWEGRFQEVTEAHLEQKIVEVCARLGIQQQSFWAGYSDLLDPEELAKLVHTSMQQSDTAHEGVEGVTVPIATAARVLVSLGQVPICLADGRNSLRTKAGLINGLGIVTMAGNAITAIAFEISKAEAGQVHLPGEAVYNATEAMAETIQKLQQGTWSTGEQAHDDLLIKGISADRALLSPTARV